MNEINNDSQLCPVCGKLPNARQPNHHLQPGSKLNGRYIVGNSIGEGGFGITYIGRDENLDLRVAVKEYYPSGVVLREEDQHLSVIKAGDNESLFLNGRSKFIDESRILAKFSGSDGIVDVRDYFEENNTAYIVMEYLEGMTLRQTVKEKGTMSLRESVSLLAPVMKALSGIHARGLIHRDISPDNIMLTKSKVKLLDFGSARNISSDSNTVIIKPGFAPEEQYRSDSDQTEALDVYSMSATIYFCITGIVPPAGITRVHQDTLQVPSQLGITISPQEEQALLKGLSVSAEGRYQSIAALQSALEVSLDSDAGDDELKTMLADTAVVGSAVSAPVTEEQPRDPSPQPFTPINIGQSVSNDRVAPQQRVDNIKKDNKRKSEKPLPIKDDRFDIRSDNKPDKKAKRSPVKIIIGIVAAVLVVAIIGFVFIAGMAPKLGKTTINGKDVRSDSTSYSFSDTNVTADMLKSVDTKLDKLESLNFSKSTMDAEAISYLVSMQHVKYLVFKGCPYPDFSFLSQMPQLTNLDLSFCDLDNEKFAKIDFSTLNDLKKINLDGNDKLSDISPLGSKPALVTLEASQCQIRDFSFIGENFPMLYNINLTQNNISDLSGFEKFQALTELRLDYNEITDISPLSNLKTLNSIYLNHNKITNISPLSDLQALQFVFLNQNEITDISPLGGIETLYFVSLTDNKISDISPLANKDNLNCLHLNNNEIERVDALSTDKNLQKLYLKNNQIIDLSGMEQNIHLEVLNLSANKITDISPLVNTTIISELNLNDNQVEDLSPLANTAASLKRLYFNNNRVKDISVLSASSSIQYISFDNNQVSDVAPLQKCTSLRGVSAEHNQISSLTAFSGCDHLQYLYLSFNQIEDIEPISNANTIPSSFGNAPTIYINLSNNNIKKLVFGSEMTYNYLAIHGNPINEIVNLPKEATYLSISYYDDLDPAVLEESTFNQFQIVDCPLDKQVSFEKSLNKTLHSHVNFATEEEANAAIAAQKHNLLYGESMDDHTDDPEASTEPSAAAPSSPSATE